MLLFNEGEGARSEEVGWYLGLRLIGNLVTLRKESLATRT